MDLPHVLRDLLLQRVAQLDRMTQDMLRVAAAAGRDVPYPLLRTVAGAPEGELRQVLRRAVEHGVLVGDQTAGTFRFRHALLAEAIYGTLLPGEREDLHARLAAELARSPHQVAAELAQHWAAAGRAPEALVASVAAAREAEAVAGLAEALQHLERALEFWDLVPEAAELVGLDLGALLVWTAEVASEMGAGPRAVALVRRAIALSAGDPVRAALLNESLGRFLIAFGSYKAALAAFGTAVELVPAVPITPQRAHVLAALGHALCSAGATTSHASSASRHSGWPSRSAHDGRSSGRWGSSGSTLPTSAAPRRGSAACGRRSTSPKTAASRRIWGGRTSSSPTCSPCSGGRASRSRWPPPGSPWPASTGASTAATCHCESWVGWSG